MKKYSTLLLGAILSFSSCDFLDVEPVGKVIPDEVTEFRALMTSAYNSFPKYKQLLSVRSDEMVPYAYGLTFSEYQDIALWNDSERDPLTPKYPWTQMYNTIFYANSVIEDVMNAKVDTKEDTKEQLLGEAYLLRAYAHFELLNLYAVPYNSSTASEDKGIPMQLKIDINQSFGRSSVQEVYSQVLEDIRLGLEQIQVDEQEENVRYRFSRKSALALKARVLTYMEDWSNALSVCEELLPSLELEDLNKSTAIQPHHYKSKESLLALEMPITTIILDDMNMSTEYMSSLFDTQKEGDLYRDQRLNTTFKYSPWSGFTCKKLSEKNGRISFRSSEIFLLAAENAVRLNKKEFALTYISSLLKNRMMTSLYEEKVNAANGMNSEELLTFIMEERSRELAAEGHRWYDLRRTTRPAIRKSYYDANFDEISGELSENDSRYVISFPKEALTNNPSLMD